MTTYVMSSRSNSGLALDMYLEQDHCSRLEGEISKDDIDKIMKKLKEKIKNAPEEIKCNCVKGQCSCGRS